MRCACELLPVRGVRLLSAMEQRIAELEIKFMEQESTLESLSEQVYLQQKEIARLAQALDVMKDRMKAMAQSPVASAVEETPPPHY